MTWTRITFDLQQFGGMACVRNLRIPVATVVRCVANGMTIAQIIDAYPDLEEADIAESLNYAAALTEDRVIPLRPTGT